MLAEINFPMNSVLHGMLRQMEDFRSAWTVLKNLQLSSVQPLPSFTPANFSTNG